MAIELRDLRRSFGRTEALRGLDLAVPQGSVFGFLGPNGAGKTTTMKILMGLLPPSSGSARILGFDVERDGLRVRRRVGYLPQQPAYPEHLTASGVVALAARLRGVDVDPEAQLDAVGLAGKGDRRVGGLSGGEAQRLGLAQALVGDPEVLVLDEPSAGLDPAGRREILDLLDGLRERATIMFSTHLLDDVARVSDTIAVLADGEIVADGPIGMFVLGGSSASWTVGLAGPPSEVDLAAIAGEAWVDSVEPAGDGSGALTVHAVDRALAESRLLPALRAAGAEVTEFRPARRSLEDIYLEIVGDDDDS